MGNCVPAKKVVTDDKPGVEKKSSKKGNWYEQLPEDDHRDDMKHIEMLEKDDFSDVKPFTMKDKLLPARITLHDGDTGMICYYYRNERMKRPLRFYGCDAPEFHPNKKFGEYMVNLEKKAAIHVFEKLQAKILSINAFAILWVKFCKEEKYGRCMGKIYPYVKGVVPPSGQELDVSQWLIDQKYAKVYLGKAKETWTKSELLYILKH